MPLFAALAGSAIGAGMNLLSAMEERRNLEKQKSQLQASKISAAERARLLRDLDRGFNANISRDMNSMALSTRGADASLAKAAALGQAEGTRIGAKSELYGNIISHNKSIQAQIATLGDVNYSTAAFTGAIEGGIAGNQIGELLDKKPKPEDDKVGKIIGEGLEGDQGLGPPVAPATDDLPDHLLSKEEFNTRLHRDTADNIIHKDYGFSDNSTTPARSEVKTSSAPIEKDIYKGPVEKSIVEKNINPPTRNIPQSYFAVKNPILSITSDLYISNLEDSVATSSKEPVKPDNGFWDTAGNVVQNATDRVYRGLNEFFGNANPVGTLDAGLGVIDVLASPITAPLAGATAATEGTIIGDALGTVGDVTQAIYDLPGNAAEEISYYVNKTGLPSLIPEGMRMSTRQGRYFKEQIKDIMGLATLTGVSRVLGSTAEKPRNPNSLNGIAKAAENGVTDWVKSVERSNKTQKTPIVRQRHPGKVYDPILRNKPQSPYRPNWAPWEPTKLLPEGGIGPVNQYVPRGIRPWLRWRGR